MTAYRLTNNALGPTAQTIVREADGAFVPADPNNADYQAYLAWLAAGNEPDQAPAVDAGPPTVTFLQFMALFTPLEQAAIVNSADTQTRIFLLMATGSGSISLGDPEVIAGVNYLATPATASPPGPGLIASARPAQILANAPPAS